MIPSQHGFEDEHELIIISEITHRFRFGKPSIHGNNIRIYVLISTPHQLKNTVHKLGRKTFKWEKNNNFSYTSSIGIRKANGLVFISMIAIYLKRKRQNTTYKRSVNKHDSKQKGSVCYDLQHSRIIIIINKIQNNIQAPILMQLIVIPNFVHNQLRTNSWYSIRAVTVLLLMKLADNRASRRLYGSYKITSYNRLDASSSFQAFPC